MAWSDAPATLPGLSLDGYEVCVAAWDDAADATAVSTDGAWACSEFSAGTTASQFHLLSEQFYGFTVRSLYANLDGDVEAVSDDGFDPSTRAGLVLAATKRFVQCGATEGAVKGVAVGDACLCASGYHPSGNGRLGVAGSDPLSELAEACNNPISSFCFDFSVRLGWLVGLEALALAGGVGGQSVGMCFFCVFF